MSGSADREILLAPSVLSADPMALGASIDAVKDKADWLHIDIMDGHYVPNMTYGPGLVRALRKRYGDMFIDVHLMVEMSDDFIPMFTGIGADLVTVHVESSRHLHRVLHEIKASGAKCGVSLNPATPLVMIDHVLDMVDLVLIMSVDPGFGGQTFIESTLGKAKDLVRRRTVSGAKFLIEIDGGINASNARAAAAAGCDVLVAGNAVFGAASPADAAQMIKDAAMGR